MFLLHYSTLNSTASVKPQFQQQSLWYYSTANPFILIRSTIPSVSKACQVAIRSISIECVLFKQWSVKVKATFCVICLWWDQLLRRQRHTIKQALVSSMFCLIWNNSLIHGQNSVVLPSNLCIMSFNCSGTNSGHSRVSPSQLCC